MLVPSTLMYVRQGAPQFEPDATHMQLEDDGAHPFEDPRAARRDVDKRLPLATFAVNLQQLDGAAIMPQARGQVVQSQDLPAERAVSCPSSGAQRED